MLNDAGVGLGHELMEEPVRVEGGGSPFKECFLECLGCSGGCLGVVLGYFGRFLDVNVRENYKRNALNIFNI